MPGATAPVMGTLADQDQDQFLEGAMAAPARLVRLSPERASAGVFLGAEREGARLSWHEVLPLLRGDEGFQDSLTQAISETSFSGLFFECAPLSGASAAETPFECALLDAPSLGRISTVDLQSFAVNLRHGAEVGAKAVSFPSLGRDAMLTVPVPQRDLPETAYIHLAAFCRGAARRPELSRALWTRAATALSEEIANAPNKAFWFSTSGLGVSYLHVRVDTRPKYYTHAPYTRTGYSSS